MAHIEWDQAVKSVWRTKIVGWILPTLAILIIVSFGIFILDQNQLLRTSLESSRDRADKLYAQIIELGARPGSTAPPLSCPEGMTRTKHMVVVYDGDVQAIIPAFLCT